MVSPINERPETVCSTTPIAISMTSKGVAFITGASQGIGRATTLRLADDGFDVAVNDLPRAQYNLDELSKDIIDKGRKTFVITGDVSVDLEVETMITSMVENLGSLDIVSTRLPGGGISIHYTDRHAQMVANAGICLAKSVVESTLSSQATSE